MRRDIFISYSRNDLDAVRLIKEEIEAATGKECWMDLNGIESGSVQFAKYIIKGIKDCKVFLFMLSESSQSSEFALRELNFAYKQSRERDKKVVIVNITGCRMTDEFDFMYGLTDTITWSNAPEHDKLIRDLKRWLGDNMRLDKEEKANEEEQKHLEQEEMKQRVEEGKRCVEEEKQEEVFDVKGVQFKMIYVQGGIFSMGATPEQDFVDDDEEPVHDVSLSDFYIGETPVTQALWKAVMGTELSFNGGWDEKYGIGSDYPAYRVNWNDCQEFIRKLEQLTGKKFRLPTEAEWEFAARGGNKSRGYKYAGSNNVGDVAWYNGNSDGKTHPVKTKSPNELGLYDMSGNVWEWCQDWYGRYDSSMQTNPKGPSSGSNHVLRGGSWYYRAWFCRVSFRNNFTSDSRRNRMGFRLVLVQ